MENKTDNICRFVPSRPVPDVLHTVHFVYETAADKNRERRLNSVYRVHLVTEGKALLQMSGISRELFPGDIFFTFPAVPYRLEAEENFRYLYIGFLGLRASFLLERLGITNRNFVFHGGTELDAFWRRAIGMSGEVLDLISESVLLYTLSHIGEAVLSEKERTVTGTEERMLVIKQYLDDHFSDPELTLSRMGEEFSYHPKYLSTAFKKQFHVGIREYLNTIRINHACALMEQGYSSVKDIAALCGYRDQMYFTRVFREQMTVPPREHIRSIKEKGTH